MSRRIDLAFLSALLSVTACAVRPAPPSVSAADQAFLIAAVATTIFDVRSAALALDRANDPKTRHYAEQVADASNEIGHRLDALADTDHVPRAIDMTADQRRAFAALQGAEPFDPAFFQQQVLATRGAIDLYQAEVSSGADPECRQLAAATLPVLRQRLQLAQAGGA